MRSRASAISVSILIVVAAVTSTCAVTDASRGQAAFDSYAAAFAPELITAAIERRLAAVLTTDRLGDVVPVLAEKSNASGARVATRLVGARGDLAATIAGLLENLPSTVEAKLSAARSNDLNAAAVATTRREIKKAVIEALEKRSNGKDFVAEPTGFERMTATWLATLFPARDDGTLLAARVRRDELATGVHALASADTVGSAVADLFVPTPQTMGGVVTLVGRDLAARRTWAAVALLFCICWIALMTIATWRIVEELGKAAGILTFAASVGTGLLIAGGWWMFRQRFSWTPLLADDVLAVFVEQRGLGIVDAALVFNVLAMVAVTVVLGASWSTFWRDSADLPTVERQRESLRLIFNAAAAVMVAGVLEVSALYGWPSTLLDTESSKAVNGLANSIAALAAVLFSTILCAAYFPAASVLARRRETLVLAPVQTAATNAAMNALQAPAGASALSSNPQQAAANAAVAGANAAAFTATLGTTGGLPLVDPASQTFARLFQALGPIIAGLPLAALVEFLTNG